MNGSWSRALTLARSNAERVTVWALVVAIIVVTGLGWVVTHPLSGSEASIATVRANDQVALSQHDGTYVLEPTNDEPTAGLVFYPGARVAPDAYLASLAPLVGQADIAVYVPRMPLNLAVFDPGTASDVIAEHQNIDRWFVGGHSLGGSMACRYTSNHRGRVDGLVLFASFCEAGVTPNVSILSVTGSADTVLNGETYAARRGNFPANATVVEIQGMNHSQLGSYTGQRGDQPASIGYRTAHDRLADVTVPWFENRTTQQPSPLIREP
jgi:hypothetical protein